MKRYRKCLAQNINNCHYVHLTVTTSFTLSPKYKFVVTHKLFRNYVDYYLSIQLQVCIICSPEILGRTSKYNQCLNTDFKRQKSSHAGNDVNPVDLARAGTSGLPGSSQIANPVPSSSTKMEIPTPHQGRVYKELVLFKTKKGWSQLSLFLLPVFHKELVVFPWN